MNSSPRSHSPISYVSSSSEEEHENKNLVNETLQNTKIPPVDPLVLTDLEEQAKYTSKSLSKLMAYLTKHLSDISNVTNETVSIYDQTIQHTQAEVEKNIHAMYGLISKCEELDRKMKPVTELANQVSYLNRMLDEFEHLCK